MVGQSRKILAAAVTALLAGCGPAAIPSGIDDPYEQSNRQMHALNTDVDKALFRPASRAYGGGLPQPVRQKIGNFAGNLDLPRSVVNNILQVDPADAVHNTLRFVVNTTIGIGGLFDPATAIGLDERSTDFGATLHVWGVPEGPYVEMPFAGPSTQRDSAGTLVDFFLNPLTYVLPSPERYTTVLAKGLSRVGDRYTYGTTVDSILYDSADSYAQARVLYLESRRYELRRMRQGGGQADEEYIDPYGGAVADDTYVDPYAVTPDYIDPYEDLE